MQSSVLVHLPIPVGIDRLFRWCSTVTCLSRSNKGGFVGRLYRIVLLQRVPHRITSGLRRLLGHTDRGKRIIVEKVDSLFLTLDNAALGVICVSIVVHSIDLGAFEQPNDRILRFLLRLEYVVLGKSFVRLSSFMYGSRTVASQIQSFGIIFSIYLVSLSIAAGLFSTSRSRDADRPSTDGC